MRVAVASGKGGTGKTTIAASLAHILAKRHAVQYCDCDVEEPNGHLFLAPEITRTDVIHILVPRVDAELCTHCGDCSTLCQFHAIAALEQRTMVFPELCHGCGGCVRVCPVGAISEVEHRIGVVEQGNCGALGFVQGRLDVGVALSPPLIRAARQRCDAGAAFVILDAPPGTTCPVVATVRECDLVLLVTEPTPFGLHDLALAVEMVRSLRLPMAVVINRADVGDDAVEGYCVAEGIPVWARIPHDRRIAVAYSRGVLPIQAVPDVVPLFEALAQIIEKEASPCARS